MREGFYMIYQHKVAHHCKMEEKLYIVFNYFLIIK